ncbi:hypothetical protein QBC47DRAFT_399234 [Echria macrotheca]|uniref:Uncharacterized protein n=1 Tax=Echria macrotheca TaxID=438768 RepID=A0AAJ0FCG5_9PEZI|nr:hypothetical protein QBC47DRAFT_399234 [Echria macrotheca]
MAGFGGVFKRAGFTPAKSLRPGVQHRTHSNSSDVSIASEDDMDGPFAFSTDNTPSTEQPPLSRPPLHGATPTAQERLLLGKQVATAVPEAIRSNPIPIEHPTYRKPKVELEGAPAETPPSPLSARGDIQGGYFPHHEDPTKRLRSHPFQLDARKAKHQSLRAAESITSAPPIVPVSGPETSSPAGTMSSAHTPVSSYLPMGVPDGVALPLGKYYPSNYEKRYGQQRAARDRISPWSGSGPGTAVVRSEPQVPRLRQHESSSSHARTSSDVKRKLQQYQRDMVAQATVAANELLLGKGKGTSREKTAAAAADARTLLRGGPFPNHIELGEALIKTHKPVSPRLAPLGSPGPVTPMSLELEGDSYLAVRGGTAAPVAAQLEQQVVETSRSSPIHSMSL